MDQPRTSATSEKTSESRKEPPSIPAPKSFRDSGYGTNSKTDTTDQARSTGRSSTLSQEVPLLADSIQNSGTQDLQVIREESKEQAFMPIFANSGRIPQASWNSPLIESASSPNFDPSGHGSKTAKNLPPSDGDETGSNVSNDTLLLPSEHKLYMVKTFVSHLLATVRQDQNDLVLEEKLSEHSKKIFEGQLREYSRAIRTYLKDTIVLEPGVTKRVLRAIDRDPGDIIAKFNSLAADMKEDENEIEKPPTVISNSHMDIAQSADNKVGTWQVDISQEPYAEHPDLKDWNDDGSDTSFDPEEDEDAPGLESIDVEAIKNNLTSHPAFEVLVNQVHNIMKDRTYSITSSAPSTTLIAQDEFSMHDDDKISDFSSHSEEETAVRPTGRLHKGILRFCSHLGLREPNIPPGHKRIRWTNRHGKSSYDDYVEHVLGALDALEGHLRSSVDRSSPRHEFDQGQAASANPHRNRSNNRSTPAGGPNSGGIAEEQREDLYSNGEENRTTQSSTMHLISCMETWSWRRGRLRSRIQLHEDIVTSVPDDCQLFQLLRVNYDARKGGLFWRLVSPRTLKSINFMKVDYYNHRDYDLRWHEVLCQTGQPCSCMPPTKLVKPTGKDYSCSPVPAALSPPIGPNRMMNAFEDPESLHRDSIRFFEQLPKRICGELLSQDSKRTVAWGIIYKEGWNWFKIYMMAIFHPVLLFFVFYSSFAKDVTGAATVVSAFLALVTIPVTIYFAQSPSI